MISRRDFLAMAAIAPLKPRAATPQDTARPRLDVERNWHGPHLRPRIVNRTSRSARVDDVVVFERDLALAADTALYGEGFQMLTQTAGTLGAPIDLSQYTDAGHYRLRANGARRAFYGLLALSPASADTHVYAFTSCRRFSGRFEFDGSTVRAIIDCEGLELRPGASWPLEELTVISGRDRPGLLEGVAARLAAHHPRRVRGASRSAPPTGWCSWYCFGPNVTAQQVLQNLDTIATSMPALRYIQIDDGYQRAMGDWLETGSAFGGSIRTVLAEIRRRGFEPAIWVAPFIAEAQSHVFEQHPEWFIQDAAGAPLRSDRVTFGGWRRGPWYALDGTHPAVQAHFERVFQTLRAEWGCTYFKLDATFWGAMHGGRFHDRHATRVEAYRRGMAAIARGAGDAFLLGCNHPIWPSVGLLDGSRSSNDIKRSWDRIKTTARQNLSRNWQNGRLWWNDPDAVVLAGDLADEECRFHATAIYATGGMILSGDDLTRMPAARAAMLRKLLPPTGVAAVFADGDFRLGVVTLPASTMICVFNWDDREQISFIDLTERSHRLVRRVSDFWNGEIVPHDGGRVTLTLPPRSARLLVVSS